MVTIGAEMLAEPPPVLAVVVELSLPQAASEAANRAHSPANSNLRACLPIMISTLISGWTMPSPQSGGKKIDDS
ncbi:MAG: hypothetical protein O7C61_07115 [SAR324 cluster bacterium]|nr:hypothetical protein [SAR324 cluster bacterium]